VRGRKAGGKAGLEATNEDDRSLWLRGANGTCGSEGATLDLDLALAQDGGGGFGHWTATGGDWRQLRSGDVGAEGIGDRLRPCRPGALVLDVSARRVSRLVQLDLARGSIGARRGSRHVMLGLDIGSATSGTATAVVLQCECAGESAVSGLAKPVAEPGQEAGSAGKGIAKPTEFEHEVWLLAFSDLWVGAPTMTGGP